MALVLKCGPMSAAEKWIILTATLLLSGTFGCSSQSSSVKRDTAQHLPRSVCFAETGLLFESQGRTKSAIISYEHAINADPTNQIANDLLRERIAKLQQSVEQTTPESNERTVVAVFRDAERRTPETEKMPNGRLASQFRPRGSFAKQSLHAERLSQEMPEPQRDSNPKPRFSVVQPVSDTRPIHQETPQKHVVPEPSTLSVFNRVAENPTIWPRLLDDQPQENAPMSIESRGSWSQGK